MDFHEDTACAFAGWFEVVFRAACEQDPTATKEEGEDRMRAWFPGAARNFAQVRAALNTEYDLPELEKLRKELCFCVTMGLWQASICLTNVLLERFLKSILIYNNTTTSCKGTASLPEMLGTLEVSQKKYEDMGLSQTTSEALEQHLIEQEVKAQLDVFRIEFRNSFFHANPKKMFSDTTIRVTEYRLDTGQRKVHEEVPSSLFMPLHGDVMWGFAKENAIPYFIYVDHLIRATLPKVFGKEASRHVPEKDGAGEST
jgi:hypothetical protein